MPTPSVEDRKRFEHINSCAAQRALLRLRQSDAQMWFALSVLKACDVTGRDTPGPATDSFLASACKRISEGLRFPQNAAGHAIIRQALTWFKYLHPQEFDKVFPLLRDIRWWLRRYPRGNEAPLPATAALFMLTSNFYGAPIDSSAAQRAKKQPTLFDFAKTKEIVDQRLDLTRPAPTVSSTDEMLAKLSTQAGRMEAQILELHRKVAEMGSRVVTGMARVENSVTPMAPQVALTNTRSAEGLKRLNTIDQRLDRAATYCMQLSQQAQEAVKLFNAGWVASTSSGGRGVQADPLAL